MRSNTNQNNEKNLQKRGILQDYTLRISGAENYEEIINHIFDAINATIDADVTIVGQVHLGVLKGTAIARGPNALTAKETPTVEVKPRSPRAEPGKRGIIGWGEGLPLDGPSVTVRAINTRKTCNVPDTRADPDYLPTEVGERGQTLSQMAVPVLSHGKSIGVVSVAHLELNAFDETDQRLLEEIAEYAGYSFSRIRYSERLIGLHLLASELSSSKNISEIAENTLNAMVNILDLESCEFLLVQDDVSQSILRKGFDETIQLREKVHELSIAPERLREASVLDFLSTLEVPVEVEYQVVAILRAESIRADAYSEQDTELVETLANHVSSAIQRIRLLESQIQYETKLEALHQHANNLTNSTKIEEIAEYTIDAMYATLGMKTCDFYIQEEQYLRLISYRGWIPTDPDHKWPLDGPGILVKTANTKKTILLSDIREEPSYFEYPGYAVAGEEAYRPLSELCVPVISGDEVVAVLNTESNQLDFYDERDQELLETLASHVALNIQRIRLLEAQIQYEAKLEALHIHTSKLADAGSIAEISDYTVDAMSNTLGYRWGLFMMIESDHLITLRSLGEYSGRIPDPIPFNGTRGGITVRSAKTGETQLVNDTRLDKDHRTSEGTLSELDVPMKIEDEVIGVLNVESLELNAFTEQDQELLEILASHVASAIQRIRLLEAQIQYEAKLEALHVHASKLADASSIEEIAEYTIGAMETTLGFTWISMSIVEDNLLKTAISSRSGSRSRDETNTRHIDSPGIGTRAIRTGETQLVNDTRKDIDYVGTWMDDSKLSQLDEKIRKVVLDNREASGVDWGSLSEIEVPVKIDQTVVALLGAESLELNAFTEQDQKLLETLASHVASAMMRIQHYEERERVQQELALERVRAEQADELTQLKNQFISTATHELRTPVTSILGFLELVLDYSSQDLSDPVRKDLNVVFRNAMRLVDLTNDLLDVQRITSGRFEVNLEQVDLMNTLNEVVEELTPLFDEKQQVLLVNAPSELVLQVDEIRISQLFINLLRNANKFTPEMGNINVTVEPSESHVQMSFKDSGIGLREEDIKKLFKPFPGIRHGVNVSSTGLGLAICKGIVDVHLGVIWVESDGPGTGSTFFVRIPVGH